MHFRVGADTNLLFSGLFFAGAPHDFLERVLRKELTLFLSQYVVDELLDVLRQKNVSEESFQKLLELENVRVFSDDHYISKALFTEGRGLVRDLNDVPVYAFAAYGLRTGIFDYFVTGDADLLVPPLRKALAGKMVSVPEFFEVLAPKT